MSFANYLPDELLLEILEYVEAWETHERQASLAGFCCVSRQWYDVGIRKLYESPYLSGRAYELFVRTICPSVIPRIRPSSLAGLVRVLDLSHIVHNSNKATTASESEYPPKPVPIQRPVIANDMGIRITRPHEELAADIHCAPGLVRSKLLGVAEQMHSSAYPRSVSRVRGDFLPEPQSDDSPTPGAARAVSPALQLVLRSQGERHERPLAADSAAP